MRYYIAKTFTDENGRETLLSIKKFIDICSAKIFLRRKQRFQHRKNISATPDQSFLAELSKYKHNIHLDTYERYDDDTAIDRYTSYILFPSKFLMHFKKMYRTKSIRWQKCNLTVPCTPAAAFDEDIPC